MEITFPGFFLLPLGVILWIVSDKYLYYTTIFSIPFTATSLVNSEGGAAFVAANYFIILLIFAELRKAIFSGKIKMPYGGKNRLSIRYMFIFMGIVLLTLFMPAIIDGKLWVNSAEATPNAYIQYTKPVVFSFMLFKRIYPLVMGILFTYIVVIRNNSPVLIRKTIKIYISAVFFLSVWGWFEIITFFSSISYPGFIFNTMNESYQSAVGTLYEYGSRGFLRVSSVTQEPSHLALITLTIVPIFIVSFVKKQVIFSAFFDRLIFITILSIIVMSTSTTAIVGLFLCYLVFIIISYRNKIIKIRYLILIGVIIFLSVFLIYIFSSTFRDYFNAVVLDKGDTSSAIVRQLAILSAWSYFLKYPILGVGWSIVTSNDLIVYILANSGILGLFSFIIMVYHIILTSTKNIRKLNLKFRFNNYKYGADANGIVISFILFLSVSTITEFTWYQPVFYLLMGLLIAFNSYAIRIIIGDNSVVPYFS
jgi:hypothetical protein